LFIESLKNNIYNEILLKIEHNNNKKHYLDEETEFLITTILKQELE